MNRLIFAGTPEFAARALEALLAAGHRIALVLTQPDRPAGRGLRLQPSAVKQVALAHGLPVFQPARLADPATHAPLREAAADFIVVAAYGLILPQVVLDLPRHGGVNIHASLLPRWRGAAPIQRAIEAGDAETGITIMQMEAGLDSGPMLLAQPIKVGAGETAGELHDRLADLGATLIVDALARYASLTPQPQLEHGVTYAKKIDKLEARLDWNAPAEVLARKIRAFNPFPGATLPLAGEAVKIWRAEVVDPAPDPLRAPAPGQILAADAGHGLIVAAAPGALRLIELQHPGGRRITSADFLRGQPRLQGAPRLAPGFRLSPE
ncbi:MAG: methionyl-tRNA formyltransferase [Betaproteobacteria bacterium HGW-Betaproteobacteria-11]|nr:MAG: methionyl-tRNA formyltransferase [Betaproteobacteria bacterium HGW-Betaproteobacteria-11]